jgi:ATP-binding cassette, subfamily B, bacterial MsbA
VQEAIERLMVGRTTLVIAHRLSTIRTATRIAVVEHGRIVEQGSHAELLARSGEYRRLYEMQFHDEPLAAAGGE